MNQPTTPNTVEDFLPLPKPYFASRMNGGMLSENGYTADQVRAAILADRAQRPTVAGSVDTPEFHNLAISYRGAGAQDVAKAWDAMVAHINARLAPAAPSGEAVAWAVVSPKGGIHKLSIKKDSADRKCAAWLVEWPFNRPSVRPLVFGDCAAPSEIEAAVELPEKPEGKMHDTPAGHEIRYTTKQLVRYATEAVLKDRASMKGNN